MIKPKARKRFWRDAEVGFAIAAKQAGWSNEEIAAQLRRSWDAVGRFFDRHKGVSTAKPIEEWLLDLKAIPSFTNERTLAERDARLSLAPRDLTAAMMGDPLPGCSALERRS